MRWSTRTDEATWLASDDETDLVLGPTGYEAYARLRLLPDPVRPRQQEGDVPSWPDEYPTRTALLADAVDALAPHTTTADDALFLVWDSGVSTIPAEVRARSHLPLTNRDTYLAEGTLAELRNWHDNLRLDEYDKPCFIWPRDRAWCLVHDVDPHFAGACGTPAAIAALLAVPRLHAVPQDRATRPPLYY